VDNRVLTIRLVQCGLGLPNQRKKERNAQKLVQLKLSFKGSMHYVVAQHVSGAQTREMAIRPFLLDWAGAKKRVWPQDSSEFANA
jgi:hypothetical protein